MGVLPAGLAKWKAAHPQQAKANAARITGKKQPPVNPAELAKAKKVAIAQRVNKY